MAQLILIDKATKQELGRRDMAPQERYQFYRDCSEHVLMLFQGKFYTIHGVAWRLPEEDFMASVTYHSNEVLGCGCAVGGCTCD